MLGAHADEVEHWMCLSEGLLAIWAFGHKVDCSVLRGSNCCFVSHSDQDIVQYMSTVSAE